MVIMNPKNVRFQVDQISNPSQIYKFYNKLNKGVNAFNSFTINSRSFFVANKVIAICIFVHLSNNAL